MPFVYEQIPSNFVGNFHVGDDLVYNSYILCDLLERNQNRRFNKLASLQAAAVVEASLAELIFRAQHYNREGVPRISAQDQHKLSGKKLDKFSNVISVLKKYDVLVGLRDDIYEELHRLRKIRNKIHIQDAIAIEGFPQGDRAIFSDDVLHRSINLNSDVLRFLSNNFARPEHLHAYVDPLKVPRWVR